jgi:RimJ/RimL family protein N-acetyltransferase
MYYSITGKNYMLVPLFEEKGLVLLSELCAKKDFRESSLVYAGELNFSDSMFGFGKFSSDDPFWATHRLYVIADLTAANAYGLVGLSDMDFFQRRAEVVLILDDDAAKNKVAYEPLKLLLAKAVKEWQMRRLWCRVKVSDTQSMVVLKGLGFTPEGKLREDVKIGPDALDVTILGLLDREFHVVENA